MSKNGTPRTSSAEIAILQSLTQKSTAWLLGLKSARSLGERVDCPRNIDQTYDAHAVVDWWQKRRPAKLELAALNDVDLTRISVLGRYIDQAAGVGMVDVLKFFDRIESDYGQPGLLAVLNCLRSEWQAWVDENPEGNRKPTVSEIKAKHQAACDAELAKVGVNLLDEVYYCGECNRTCWCEDKWKSGRPPAEWAVVNVTCEDCYGGL